MAKLRSSLLDMPLAFELNRGQTDAKVNYLTRAQNFTVFLMPGETVLRGRNADVLRIKLQNSNQSPKAEGEDRQAKISNYFIGSDRSKWLHEVPNFGQVRYRDVYSGIDMVYHSDQRQLEYDFVVKPGANPNQIQLAFEGASKIAINDKGELQMDSAAGTTVNHKPVVYQNINGQRKLVQGEYALVNNKVSFKVGEYDHAQPLVIDPTLQVLSFFGGTLNDEAAGVATSAVQSGITVAGVVFVGRSESPALPVGGTPKTTGGITWDAFATGLNGGTVGVPAAAGNTLLWTTYFGGNGDDSARGVVLDNQGNVFIAGYTNSSNFPMAGVASTYDAFVAKLSATGGGLSAATLFGGPGVDQATSIALDYSTFSSLANASSIINPAADSRVTPNIVIGGLTSGNIGSLGSPTFTGQKTPDGNQTAFNSCTAGNDGCGTTDGFVAILTPALAVLHSTYHGGGGNDQITGVAADIWGNVYATGFATPNVAPVFPIVNGIGNRNPNVAQNSLRDASLIPEGVLSDHAAAAFVAKWACTTTTAATPNNPIGVPSPGPGTNQIQACGGTNNLKTLSNSAMFGGSALGDTWINPQQVIVGGQGISESGLGIAVDNGGWGQQGVSGIAPNGFFNAAGYPDIVPANESSTTACNLAATGSNGSPATNCAVSSTSGTNPTGTNPAPNSFAFGNGNSTDVGGFQPGMSGPHVYVVGMTASRNFVNGLVTASCTAPPLTSSTPVPAICPVPEVWGGAVTTAGTLPTVFCDPLGGAGVCPAPAPTADLRIKTVAGGTSNSGQTQGWLVSFQFPAVTQAIVQPPDATAPVTVTTLAPSTIPNYIVLQPATCPQQSQACINGGTTTFGGGRPPAFFGCTVGGGGFPTCPNTFLGSWNAVAVDSDEQVYVVGQIGMSGRPGGGVFNIGPPTRLALELERITPYSNTPGNVGGFFPNLCPGINNGGNEAPCAFPEPLFPSPAAAPPTTSFVVDSATTGSIYGQILPGAPPAPDPNQPGGVGNGIAVNPLREAFFVATTSATTPAPAAPTQASAVATINAGAVLVGVCPGGITAPPAAVAVPCGATQTGGTGYSAVTPPTVTVTGFTGCTTNPGPWTATVTGGVVTAIAPASSGVGCTGGALTVTIQAPPAATPANASNYLTWTPIEPRVAPVPATQFNLGATGGTNASVAPATEDVLYGALQFYDAIATPNTINFTATVNTVTSIVGPNSVIGDPTTTGVNAQSFITYTNWEGQPLNIPPGCSIFPYFPAGQGNTNAFNIVQVGATAVFKVTVNPVAVTFPGVVTSFVVFDKFGTCTGAGQPVIDAFDPVTVTLTVLAPLNLSVGGPAGTFTVTTGAFTGLLHPYVENGFQLVANQTLTANVGVTTATAAGPINFTAQVVPGPNWVGPIAQAITLPTPTDIIYSVQGPGQINVPVTINTNIIAGFPEGTYTAYLLFAPTPETPATPTPASFSCFSATAPVGSGSISPACIPIRITVGGSVLSDVPATVVFRNSGTPQQTSLVISNPLSLNTPYNFTAGYVPNNFYCTPLPSQNVFFIGTGSTLIPANVGPPVTGTIPAGGQFTLPLQIDPTGLATGCYSGMVLFSNNGTVTGATPQTTVPVLVFVGPKAGEDAPSGNGLALMFPPNSPFPTGGIGGCPESYPPPPNAQFPIPCPAPGTQGTGSSTGAYPLVINVPAGMSPSQLANPTMLTVTGLNNIATTAFLVSAPVVSAGLPGVSITNPGANFGTVPSSCSGTNAPGPGTYASFSSLPLSPLGPQCTWQIYVDSTAVNSSNTVKGLAACTLTGGTGITGTLTFNPTAGSFPFSPMVVPLTVCISDSPNLNVTQPVLYPNPTYGTGIPNPNFCGSSAFPVGCPQMLVGIPIPATGIVLQSSAGNSTPACAEIGINTNGGGYSPLTGVQGVTISPFTVPWLSTASSTAPYLGTIPAFDSLSVLGTGGWGFDGGFGVEGGPAAIGAPIPVPLFYTAFGPGQNSSATAPIGSAFYATCTSGGPCSALNTVAPFPAGPATVNNAMQTLQICANTDPIGNTNGSFKTTVVINGGDNGPVTIPVTFNVGNGQNSVAGAINLPDIGVFRFNPAAPTVFPTNNGVGFILNAESGNQLTGAYNFSTASADGKLRLPGFGVAGDLPVAGDWNGTGTVSLGVFRGGQWILDLNNNGKWDGLFNGDNVYNFGAAGDIPVVGDWNGDGRSKFGVYRPTTGQFILDIAGHKAFDSSSKVVNFGAITVGGCGANPYANPACDQPVAGNWLGNGIADQIGVFRPSTGQWYLDSAGQATTTGVTTVTVGTVWNFGTAGDIAVVGNWGNFIPVKKHIGVYRPSGPGSLQGTWILDTTGTGNWNPNDLTFQFGNSSDLPIVGLWTF